MNDFKEKLKYHTNTISDVPKNIISKEDRLSHKIKKAAMIGGLSMMAAISSVGCSKSETKKTTEVTQQQVSDYDLETELSENDKAKKSLIEDTQTLIETIENYPDKELSDDDSLKLENLLLKYVFIETSVNYQGNISYNSIIPERNNSQLTGTFRINPEEKKYIENYIDYESKGLLLDSAATQLFNNYYSNAFGEKSLKNALSTLYKVELNLGRQNHELIENLSYEDLVNLMKSSYVSAYNNMLTANNQNTSEQTINASDFILYINQENDGQYSLSSYKIDDDGYHSVFETTLDSNNVKVIDDYVNTYSTFYNDSSDIDAILSNLKTANEENQVSEEELIEQLTDIALHPEKLEAYLYRTGLDSYSTEINDDGR